jgi:hypothetical protein
VQLFQEPAMSEWTQDDAMHQLDSYFDELDAICRGGLARYQDYPADVRVEHDGRATATCIYTHMVALADNLLTDKPGVIFKTIRGLKV